MKAWFVLCNDQIVLETNNGIKKVVSFSEARSFLESFDSNPHLSLSSDTTHMDGFSGQSSDEIAAYITDENHLVFVCGDFFREVFAAGKVYITPAEYAKKYDKEESIIQRFCRTGRITGAVKKGGCWIIPENAPYPADTRQTNSGRHCFR